MLKFIINCLQQRSYRVTLAYYQPFSVSPSKSVPLYKALFARPSNIDGKFQGIDCVGLGCWLPELEFTHYWATSRWRQLINANDLHLVVSGSCLAALPYVQTSTPFMAWVASDWLGDRQHRVKKFPLFRRLLDRFIVAPVVSKLERKIINSDRLIALSDHTRAALNQVAGRTAVDQVLSMPINTERFCPAPKQSGKPRIGFVGRFEDPRKHLSLLLRSTAAIKAHFQNVELVLIGDTLSQISQRLISSLGIDQNITVISCVENAALPNHLQQLDLFVLPSYQEGLCIAALEAMSCGVPVVSTRCGGPESYIVDGENGALVDHDPASMASAVVGLLADKKQRLDYASAARQVIIETFSESALSNRFWTLLERNFPNE